MNDGTVLTETMDEALVLADLPARIQKASVWVQTLVVATATDYEMGAEVMRRLKRYRNFLESIHRPLIREAKANHDKAIKDMRVLDDVLSGAFDHVKDKCEAWAQAQRDEQRRQQDAAKAALSAPAVAARNEAALAQAFDTAVENGDTAKAAHLLTQTGLPPALQTPAAYMSSPSATFVPKVEGISTSTNWTWDCLDESLVPREYLELDRKKITAVVKAMKDKTQIPGIVPRPDTGMRVRA